MPPKRNDGSANGLTPGGGCTGAETLGGNLKDVRASSCRTLCASAISGGLAKVERETGGGVDDCKTLFNVVNAGLSTPPANHLPLLRYATNFAVSDWLWRR